MPPFVMFTENVVAIPVQIVDVPDVLLIKAVGATDGFIVKIENFKITSSTYIGSQ